MKDGRALVATGAILGGLAVMLGAFGVHALKSRLGPEQLGWWQTGVQYQMWHSLIITVLGFSGARWARLPAWMLTAGALVFAGTLYAMALGGPRWLGAVTPLGGLSLVAGWVLLALRAFASRD